MAKKKEKKKGEAEGISSFYKLRVDPSFPPLNTPSLNKEIVQYQAFAHKLHIVQSYHEE